MNKKLIAIIAIIVAVVLAAVLVVVLLTGGNGSPDGNNTNDDVVDGSNSGQSDSDEEDLPEDNPGSLWCNHSILEDSSDFDMADAKYELAVIGGTCLDGVKITARCKICNVNKTETRYGKSHVGSSEEIELIGGCDNHSFSVFTCVCSDDSTLLYGDTEDIYSQELQYEGDYFRQECPRCSMALYWTLSEIPVESQCVVRTHTTWRLSYADITIAEGQNDSDRESHYCENPDVVFLGGGNSCDDGVIVSGECDECGKLIREERYSHGLSTKKVNLTGEGVCDNHVLTLEKCACGEAFLINVSNLEYDWITNEQSCKSCDLVLISTYGDFTDTDDKCYKRQSVVYTVVNGEDVLYTVEGNLLLQVHNFKDVAELVEGATSCEDGVIFRGECVDCDATYEDIYYWHEMVSNPLDFSAAGVCADHVIEFGQCVCGSEAYFHTDMDTEFNNGAFTSHCEECEVLITMSEVGETIKSETCELVESMVVVITVGGETLASYEYDETSRYHSNTKETVTLCEGSVTCEDGVIITVKCLSCGETEERIEYDHCAAYEYLSFPGLNVCDDHELALYSCACGINAGLDVYNVYSREDDELNTSITACRDCDLYIISKWGETEISEDGRYLMATVDITIKVGDIVVREYTYTVYEGIYY